MKELEDGHEADVVKRLKRHLEKNKSERKDTS
jgi:hypothetical protein